MADTQKDKKELPEFSNTTFSDLIKASVFFRSNFGIFLSVLGFSFIFAVGYLSFKAGERLVNEWQITPREHIRSLNQENNRLINKHAITALSTRILVKSGADFVDVSIYPKADRSTERISIYALDKDSKKQESYQFRHIPLDIEGTREYFEAHKQNTCKDIDNRQFGPDSFVVTRFGPNYLVSCPIYSKDKLLGMVFLLWQDAQDVDLKKVKSREYQKLIIENTLLFRMYLEEYLENYLSK